MARKADPAVQYRKLEEAMSKLGREEQLVWLAQFLGQYDTRSLLIGGILDAIELYRKDEFDPVHTYRVEGQPMTSAGVVELAGLENLEESIEFLREGGYTVEDYDAPVGQEDAGEAGHAGGDQPGPGPASMRASGVPYLGGRQVAL